jgi:hypothetical protein
MVPITYLLIHYTGPILLLVKHEILKEESENRYYRKLGTKKPANALRPCRRFYKSIIGGKSRIDKNGNKI